MAQKGASGSPSQVKGMPSQVVPQEDNQDGSYFQLKHQYAHVWNFPRGPEVNTGPSNAGGVGSLPGPRLGTSICACVRTCACVMACEAGGGAGAGALAGVRASPGIA